MILYRRMDIGDIHSGLLLCRSANWNQLLRDWEIFLVRDPESSLVAINGNNQSVLGTVTTIRYQDCFSWIGMVLVDPAHQRQGIGIGLLAAALEILKQQPTVKLDATPAGREVYKKLEFRDEYPLSRLIATSIPANRRIAPEVRPMLAMDLSGLHDLDQEAFGADRLDLLQWLRDGARQLAFVFENQNIIQGYCLGRNGYNFVHIGPVVARDLNIAKALVTAVLAHLPGKAVILDTLHFIPAWMDWLQSTGFKEQRSFMRMYKGLNAAPGIPELQYAIAGPEYG